MSNDGKEDLYTRSPKLFTWLCSVEIWVIGACSSHFKLGLMVIA
jgi:hypothetical protein